MLVVTDVECAVTDVVHSAQTTIAAPAQVKWSTILSCSCIVVGLKEVSAAQLRFRFHFNVVTPIYNT